MHVRSLLAGAGLAVVVAAVPITVVSVANADDGGTPSAPSAPGPSTPCPPGSRWEVAGDFAAAVDNSPDLNGLFDALAKAPAGTRAETARSYLADHPDARTALRDVRQEVRALRQTCRPGS